MLISKMPCLSDLLCSVSKLTTNGTNVTVENMTMTNNGNESVMTYSYPDHTILLSGLKNGTSYYYCVIAVNDTDNVTQVGEPMCDSFITRKIMSLTNIGMYLCSYVHSRLDIPY